MLFNSLKYAIFLCIVYLIYWFIVNKSVKRQNILLLFASYFFYGSWDWRFLLLLSFTILLDFYTGIQIHRSESAKARKIWLYSSVGINLGILILFKYLNFFSTSFTGFANMLGFQPDPVFLEIILPIGISFYTFHGLSYIVDIYRKRLAPTTSIVDYALFVSFFPLLVAGPIERAWHLLPQIRKPRQFRYANAVDGLRQILWGLFKKIVIADSCSGYVNQIFSNTGDHTGSTLVLGGFLFAVQLYGDFSGYSDIALGTARLLGFELVRNFNFPFFSRSIPEFWQRWHISLSTWFRDYLAIPLLAHRNSKWVKLWVTCVVFLLIGLWHGANWTFIVWGLLNGLMMIPSIFFKTSRNMSQIVAYDRNLPTLNELLGILSTFSLTILTGIFFRAESIQHAFRYLSGILSPSLFAVPDVFPKVELFLILCFFAIEWAGRRDSYAMEKFAVTLPGALRYTLYFLIAICIIVFWRDEQAFLYFQF